MKKLHRFLLASIPATDTFTIDDLKLVHQLKNVLKYEISEELIVFAEGSDDIVVRIDALDKKSVTVSKERTIPAQHPHTHSVIAAVSIIKRDLFELIVQKLTELGVTDIIPIVSARTIKQAVRTDRLELISLEAVEQSGRNTLVTIHEPMKLRECFTRFPFPPVVFDPYQQESTGSVPKKVVVYIGPEGGWSPLDEAVFAEHNVMYKKLGPTILRTETAAIVGVYTILTS